MPQVLASSRDTLLSRFGDSLCVASMYESENGGLFLVREGERRYLCVLAEPGSRLLDGFEGSIEALGAGRVVRVCPTTRENCEALRRVAGWLRPRPLGLERSFGFGDRLGIATPGHARAMAAANANSSRWPMRPVFAQQSIREMMRTKRSPQEVMDDATWGAFEGGWREGVGADADHLKTLEDVDLCVVAGFTLFTIDPGAYVDAGADRNEPAAMRAKVAALPWAELETSSADLSRRYAGVKVELGDRALLIEGDSLLTSAAKYGRAVAHVVKMARYLAEKNVDYELEISVDETETPTSAEDHFYVASELKRLGIRWVSLAPRYVGAFEKGIDYRGDLSSLRTNMIEHACIAAQIGPYKLGLHSGSDKFSVYPLIREATGGLVHVKTAGTSYMEGLRVIANLEPKLFREIATLAIERYPEDRRSYHVSADLASVPVLSKLQDAMLPRLLDEDPARQVLHVTFGSVLDRYGSELKAVLVTHLEGYYQALEKHFVRHLGPLCGLEVGQAATGRPSGSFD